MWELIGSGGIIRAARLFLQLPKESRYVNKIEPLAGWSWSEMFLMQTAFSLRQLVWSKTKDAQKKVPTGQPTLTAPEFIHRAIREAERKRGKLGSKPHTPNARVFNSTEELDAYLRKPRKSVSK
jgi:hypothetical protein